MKIHESASDWMDILEKMVSLSSDSILLTDSEGLICFVNKQLESLTGYSSEELIGKTPAIFKSGHTSAEEYARIWQTIQSGNVWKGEFQNKKKDGSLYWEKVKIIPFQTQAKDSKYFLGLKEDITKEKQYETELEAQTSLLNLFASNSQVGVFFMMLDEPVRWNPFADPEEKHRIMEYVFSHQKMTDANNAMLQQYRASREEFLGKTPADLFAHNIPEGMEVWTKFFDAGFLEYNTAESRFDGSNMWIFGSYMCIYDEEGRITGHFGIQFEITELVETKDQLERESKKSVLLAKKAQEANEAKTRLLTNANHEIRTPINAIMGYVQYALRTKDVQVQREILAKILQSSYHLLRMVEALLDMSGTEAGRLKLQPELFRLNQLIENIREYGESAAAERGINIEFTNLGIPRRAVGDQDILYRLLTYLLDHAIGVSREGTVRVTVFQSNQNEGEHRISWRIQDQGGMLDSDHMASLFEPFDKINDPDKVLSNVSGMELSVARSLAHLMRGTLNLEKVTEEGSVLLLNVPLAKPSPAAGVESIRDAYRTLDSDVEKGKLLQGKQLLVVDDSIVNTEVLSLLLEQQDIRTQTAENGRECLEYVDKFDFDAILMDLHMPVMDGYEAIRNLKKMEKSKDIPVIAVTANPLAMEYAKCMDAGFCDCISKPFTISHVMEVLYQCLFPDSQEKFRGNQSIDREAAMKRLGFDETIYNNLLRLFVEQHGEETEKISSLLEEGNLKEARRQVHTLKGAAATLGAVELSETAADLEHAIQSDKPYEIQLRLEALEEGLRIAIKTAEGMMESGEEKEPSCKDGMNESAESPCSILIVDDSVESLETIIQALGSGYTKKLATDGEIAMDLLGEDPLPDVLLLDLVMPGMSGLELIELLKSQPRYKDLPIAVLSGSEDMEMRLAAFNAGAEEFIVKPFDAGELKARLGTMVQVAEDKRQLHIQADALESQVREQQKQLSDAYRVTVLSLVKLTESRDDLTGNHINQVSDYCRKLSEVLMESGLEGYAITPAFVENVYQASPLHDIGKVGIEDKILLKPGPLTREEFDTMKKHTEIGGTAIDSVLALYPDVEVFRMARDICLYHHEKWDGSGYPSGISGEQIPLSARIMAIVDVYSALRSKRVYKDAMTFDEAVAIIEEGSGSHFDPMLVQVFLQHKELFRY